MGCAECGGEAGSKEGGVLDGRKDTEIGEGYDDEEKDDGLNWIVDGAPGEGQKRDAHGGLSGAHGDCTFQRRGTGGYGRRQVETSKVERTIRHSCDTRSTF